MPIQTDDLLAATINERRGQNYEMISKRSFLWDHLNKRGRKRFHNGGVNIEIDLIARETAGGKYFRGAETLSKVSTQVLSSAIFELKQFAIPVQETDLEAVTNKGEEKKVSIKAARLESAEITARNVIGVTGVYSDGTGTGGKQIGGLGLLVSSSPSSGTVGGIDRSVSTNSFWRNYHHSAAAVIGAKSVANMPQHLGRAKRNIMTTTQSAPNLIVMDNLDFELYEGSVQGKQQITNSNEGDVGYAQLMYQGTPVGFDGGIGGGCPNNTTFLLNTDFLELVTVEGRDFNATSKRSPVDQLLELHYITWYGNVCLISGRHQGRISA